MKPRIPLTILAAALAAGPALLAQTTTGTTADDRRTTASASGAGMDDAGLARIDRKFVEKAAIGGIAEVEKGKLATDKAASDEVKSFGKHLVDDHAKANDELKSVASGKGFTVPAETDAKQRAKMEKLSALSGTEFDRAFTKQMVKDHKATVRLFEKQAKRGQDPELRAFAEKTLPKLREHLRMAEDLDRTVRDRELPRAGRTDPSTDRPRTDQKP